MKKVFYSIALTMCLMLSVIGFSGCVGGYTVDPNNLIGVWEVSDEGGYSYITRIEFKKSTEIEGQGSYTYYVDKGSSPFYGHWGQRISDKEFDLIPEGGQYLQAQIATLADGKLWIQFNETTTIAYRKVKD